MSRLSKIKVRPEDAAAKHHQDGHRGDYNDTENDRISKRLIHVNDDQDVNLIVVKHTLSEER